ncbi:MAG: hypothetical protein RR365_14670, partial [Bacteroides sp.]
MKRFLSLAATAVSALLLSAQVPGPARETIQKHDVNRLAATYFLPARFQGKTILVTGAARGIGKWTAV